MTPQEAINHIEHEVQIDVRFCSDEKLSKTIEVFELAINALEKQKPKEPEFKAMAGFDASVASHLACPACGGGVTNYWAPGTKPAHCQFCGQALKWEEEATNAAS